MARFEFSGLFVIILKRSTLFEGKWGLRLVWSIYVVSDALWWRNFL